MIQIRELFDNPVSYTIVANHEYAIVADFTVGKIVYDFEANYWPSLNLWEVMFRISEIDHDVNFHKNSIGITGTGNATIVFSTVASLLKRFIKEKNPEWFYFTATEKSRVKLYTVFANSIVKIFPDYELTIRTKNNGEVEFLFENKTHY